MQYNLKYLYKDAISAGLKSLELNVDLYRGPTAATR